MSSVCGIIAACYCVPVYCNCLTTLEHFRGIVPKRFNRPCKSWVRFFFSSLLKPGETINKRSTVNGWALGEDGGGSYNTRSCKYFSFLLFFTRIIIYRTKSLSHRGKKMRNGWAKGLEKNWFWKKKKKKCSALFNALRFSSGGIQLLDYRSHVVITRKRMLECNGRIAKNKIKSSRSKGHRPVLGQLTIIRRNEASRETDRTRSAKKKKKKILNIFDLSGNPPPHPLFPKSKEKSGQENIKPNTYWH